MPTEIEGLAQLPHLTERELRVLLSAVDSSRRLPIGDDSETGRIMFSLHTAIAEALNAARLDARRRESADSARYDLCTDPECPVAYAYRSPFPEVDHWHYTGQPTPEPSRWVDL